ncbi:hypothetical protein H6G76_21565 [Nostoc sp. FACHB-152]|uniref:hypothetical protein n=1 Tax=unclassified Nostoc TaxID=2593658 RepID=UPI00168805A3|nr:MULTISPECIES: hypothetical protein [unclassified Nostoc]MBD2449708.1 hypothetical protein [Nostoc sp. FACHB-152]MBD2469072.1 hypothetical protein [Nostoc sp. FACHB-145]
MLNKDNTIKRSVKFCNHKPGDPWEDEGCCGQLEVANQAKANPRINEETGELIQPDEEDNAIQLTP